MKNLKDGVDMVTVSTDTWNGGILAANTEPTVYGNLYVCA